jgi:histidine triad (HIT) family protein
VTQDLSDTENCIFCSIVAHASPAYIVYEDGDTVAFLDDHPVFPGHVLLIPRQHCFTLLDLPERLSGRMMINTQLLARAVESALDAEGTFIAINNNVSQTVPHLHIHIIPRRRKDGLRGFFWPRQKYRDEQALEAVRSAIENEVARIRRE